MKDDGELARRPEAGRCDGQSQPCVRTELPGPQSRIWIDRLAKTECPAITARRARRAEGGGVDQDPVVWESARGANVVDVDGNTFVDLTAAFAVASVGHAHPDVSAAASRQSESLIHAMGDVYPGRVKIELAARLADLAPGQLEVSIFAMTGAESVEAALKSAAIATGRSTVIAFSGSYHGLSYGALAVTGYRDSFRQPFRGQLGQFGRHVPFADCYRCPIGSSYPTCGLGCLDTVRRALDDPASGVEDVAAVLVEPIQGRGGVVVPPDDWLRELSALCAERGVLLVLDEILTGFGRTGRWFACEHAGVVPDLLCVGKAMGGGFPISAVIGTHEVMDSWGLSNGEAIHTSTFLGNPLGCAMALASLDVLEREALVGRAVHLEGRLREGLGELAERYQGIGDVRGRGAMFGVELVVDRDSRTPDGKRALRVTRRLLERGYLILPSGVFGNVLSITPPLVLTDEQLDGFLVALSETLGECGRTAAS